MTLNVGPTARELTVVLVDSRGKLVDSRAIEPGALGAPPVAEEQVRAWLMRGEDQQLEFKRELPNEKAKERFADTVAAFANTRGGALLVGVDDADAAVVGNDEPHALDRLQQIITDRITDPPNVTLEEVRLEGKPIQVVHVPFSTGRPHLVNGRALVRANATNRPATPSELRGMAESSWQETAHGAIMPVRG